MTKPQVDKKLREQFWGLLTEFRLDILHSEKPFGQLRADYNRRLQALLATHTQQVREELIGKIPKKLVAENSNQQYWYDHEDKRTYQQGFNKAISDILTALGGENG